MKINKQRTANSGLPKLPGLLQVLTWLHIFGMCACWLDNAPNSATSGSCITLMAIERTS
jgi:hypothetical protein